jgi:hypothetical protein
MSTMWDTAWTVVDDYFCCLAEQLRRDHPGLGWECGHRQSATTPFKAYACFSRTDLAADDDVLVTLGFRESGSVLFFTSSITLVGGDQVAAGPGGVGLAVGEPSVWVHERVRAGLQFFGAQINALDALLC